MGSEISIRARHPARAKASNCDRHNIVQLSCGRGPLLALGFFAHSTALHPTLPERLACQRSVFIVGAPSVIRFDVHKHLPSFCHMHRRAVVVSTVLHKGGWHGQCPRTLVEPPWRRFRRPLGDRSRSLLTLALAARSRARFGRCSLSLSRSRFWFLVPGSWILDPTSWILDAGSRIKHHGSQPLKNLTQSWKHVRRLIWHRKCHGPYV